MQFLRRIFNTPHALLGITLIVVVYVGWSMMDVISSNWELQQKADELQSEIDLLELENRRLGYDIEYYKTDAYLEQAAKEKLGLRVPGERVIVLPDPPAELEPSGEAAEEPQGFVAEARHNFGQWMKFLFGI